MFTEAILWLKKKWWGLLIAYTISVVGFYLAIWATIEPFGIPDKFETLWTFFSNRLTYHIAASIVLGAHITLLLDLLIRKDYLTKGANDLGLINQLPPFDKGYSVIDSKSFYDAIADQYDQRNSPSLLQTHAEVIRVIKETVDKRSDIQVLDLGGGTGKLIAHHFFDRSDIHWVYVDSSALMTEKFRQNLNETKLSKSVEVEELNTYLSRDPDRLYDVIIISLVLTSLEKTPNLKSIASRLKPEGRLVVADIDAAYTITYPYYIVPCGSIRHALRPRAVPLTHLIHEAKKADLQLFHSHPIMEGQLNYSFVASFGRK